MTVPLERQKNIADVAPRVREQLGLGSAALSDVGDFATAAQGEKADNAAQKSANLSDLADASTARGNLGLGDSATLDVGTTTGTVAAGDDARIVGAAQTSSNLSDLDDAGDARTNLGLGSAAVEDADAFATAAQGGKADTALQDSDIGTTPGTVAAGDDSRIVNAVQLGSPNTATVLTITELAAYTTTTAYVYLNQSGKEGWFKFSGANLSAFVTADTTKAVYVPLASDATGASGAWVRQITNGELLTSWFGTTGNGGGNDAPAIRAAFVLWEYFARTNGYVGKYALRRTAGNYRFTETVDLSLIFEAAEYFYLEYKEDSGVINSSGSALVPMINFAAPDGGKLVAGKFSFGNINGNLYGGTGIAVRNVVNSRIDFNSISNCGIGIHLTSGLTSGIYNSLIQIAFLNNNQTGFKTEDTGTPPHGFQGNRVVFGHVISNDYGLHLRNQSGSNNFAFGSIEENNIRAVLDDSGYNQYDASFFSGTLEFTTVNPFTVNADGVDILNTGNAKGYVLSGLFSMEPQVPALPASGDFYRNTFKRPAMMTISGGVVTQVNVGGTAFPCTGGSFKVGYGQTVVLVYSVAPTWIWTFD